MTQAPLTKEYFDSVIKGQNGRFDGLEAAITANTREIISHFNQSQGLQNERMDVMDRKLDILIEDMGQGKDGGH